MGEDEMNEKEKKELALTEIILIILAIIGLAAMVWFAWIKPSNETAGISSYEACAEAGNPIQDSYPSVCVTSDGKRFVNPDEKISNPY
jgi:flagellar basal body-associated protein FliL